MAENLGNDFSTTLNGSITDVATTINVTSATGAPAANFRIRIDDEIMLVTSKGAGTNWTVTRGVESTTNVAHDDLADVAHVVTKGGLDNYLDERVWLVTPIDHGSELTGLGDDDHPQYFLADGSRAITGDVTVSKNSYIMSFTGTGVKKLQIDNDAGTYTDGTAGHALYYPYTDDNWYFDNYEDGYFFFRGASYDNMAYITHDAAWFEGSVTCNTIELGLATDATLARVGAGDVSIEGNIIYRAGGTDVPVTDGGTGVSLFTAYAPVIGGTTVTSPLQSVGLGLSGQVLKSYGAGASPQFGYVGATQVSVPQSTHGFSVGDVLYYTGSTYAKAKADAAATAEVVGIVSVVQDTNNFTLTMGGFVNGLSGLTAGTVYFLSDSSAGAMTATEPSTAGYVSKPVFMATSTTAGYFTNMRGWVIGDDTFSIYDEAEGTATAGQTVLTGCVYTPGLVQVFINGVALQTSDYVATDGTTVTLDSALSASDSWKVIGWTVSDAAPTLTQNFRKNAIINGDFNIWQRGTSGFVFGAYSADRWVCESSCAAVVTMSRSTDVPTVAEAGRLFNYSHLIDVTTADASVAAGDIVQFNQRIEGYNFLPLAQRDLVLSFWVKSTKTGTFCVAFCNGSDDRAFIAEYTISSANTWEKKTINIDASPSAGGWNYTTGIGLYVFFMLMCGSTYQTTAGAWQTGTYRATANQVNAMDSTDNNFLITGVQLEAGETATEFEYRTIQEELQLCERYCYAVNCAGASDHVGVGQAYGAGTWLIPVEFPTAMRTAPTLTATAADWVVTGPTASGLDVTSIAINQDGGNFDRVLLSGAVASGLTAGDATLLLSDGTSGRLMIFDAEL